MSTFEVTIQQLEIKPHPNADALELAVIGGYNTIVQKNKYQTGDWGAYIPESAVLPAWLITRLGLEGRLAGKQKNRVKAIKLRGILSQGLVVPLVGEPCSNFPDACSVAIENQTETMGVCIGDDVTEFLGITKYKPTIPQTLSGSAYDASGYTLTYDVENIKKFPLVLKENEPVVVTEKIHGTWACFGCHPDVGTIVTSKGLSAKGLALKNTHENEQNVYIQTLNSTHQPQLGNVVDRATLISNDQPIYLIGEIFGKGVQDLTYGMDTPVFRLFDVYIGTPGSGHYLNHEQLVSISEQLNIEMVPILYNGPFTTDVINQLTDGKETVSGDHANVREGVVIRPSVERYDADVGRVLLKSVSEHYLLRKNGTEYN